MTRGNLPSGPWTGFYDYHDRLRHPMDLILHISDRDLTGEGVDDVGEFILKGKFDEESLECFWVKSYLGGHDVWYEGYREAIGIWGLWMIHPGLRGGFLIWPKAGLEMEQEKSLYQALGRKQP